MGGAQLLLPAHVINEYCNSARSFSPTPDFTQAQKEGWRTRDTNNGEWFTCQYNGGGLGEKFAFCRGSSSRAWPTKHKHTITYLDQDGVRALSETRTRQRADLVTELTSENRMRKAV